VAAEFSEFHLSRLARTKALKKTERRRRAPVDMAKLSTALPAWLGSCGEVVMMESGKMRAKISILQNIQILDSPV